jgi:hypothetical protein
MSIKKTSSIESATEAGSDLPLKKYRRYFLINFKYRGDTFWYRRHIDT